MVCILSEGTTDPWQVSCLGIKVELFLIATRQMEDHRRSEKSPVIGYINSHTQYRIFVGFSKENAKTADITREVGANGCI